MPYRLTWEPEGVLREYFGDVTVAERLSSLQAICNDARFDQLRYALTDYRQVRDFETTPTSSAEIAAMHIGPTVTNPGIVIVAVSDREDIRAAIAEFKRLAFTDVPYWVFPTLPEARQWLEAQLALPQPSVPAPAPPAP